MELYRFIICVCICVLTTVYGNDIQKPYFVSVTLDCVDSSVNLTDYDPANLSSRYWIFPSGKAYKNDQGSPICGLQKCWEMDESGYNVTIKKISDDDFGIYFCVLLMNDQTIRVIRKGLNVDGPYYGDLLEKYKENAKIGGIAAAVLFIIITGTCCLWNCRYNKRQSKEDSKLNGGLTDVNMVHTVYDNKGTDFVDEKL